MKQKIPEEYDHRKVIVNSTNVNDAVLISYAFEDMKRNPENYQHIFQPEKKSKIKYNLNHKVKSPFS